MKTDIQKKHYHITAESWDNLPNEQKIEDIQALIKSPYWMMLREDDKNRWLSQLHNLEVNLEYC